MSEVTSKNKQVLKITLGDINDKNINILRKLNYDTFPVKYSTGLYMKIAAEYTAYSRLAYYNDIVIGAYTVRLEQFKNAKHAYILTFGVLEPYRKHGVGRQMMELLEKSVREDSDAVGIYLHMHVVNETGKRFYESCGFTVDEKIVNYYTNLEQPDCYVLLKNVRN